nr:immunoglobulin light chain junction region [Macaca mulatta]
DYYCQSADGNFKPFF